MKALCVCLKDVSHSSTCPCLAQSSRDDVTILQSPTNSMLGDNSEPYFPKPPSLPIEPVSPSFTERSSCTGNYAVFWGKEQDVSIIISHKAPYYMYTVLSPLLGMMMHHASVLYEYMYKALRITVRHGHIFDDTLQVLCCSFPGWSSSWWQGSKERVFHASYGCHWSRSW